MTDTTAVILCGGKGTRLHSVTQDKIPKCLVEVAGNPFIFSVLDRIESAGIRSIILAVSHMADAIISIVGTSYKTASIAYSRDDGTGTGAATKQAASLVSYPWVVVVNGDTILERGFRGFLDALDIVGGESNVLVRYNKNASAKLECCGVYVIRTSLCRKITPDMIDIDDFVFGFYNSKVFIQRNDFIDIGTPTGLNKARDYMESAQ